MVYYLAKPYKGGERACRKKVNTAVVMVQPVLGDLFGSLAGYSLLLMPTLSGGKLYLLWWFGRTI
jgi:hypothetical protein